MPKPASGLRNVVYVEPGQGHDALRDWKRRRAVQLQEIEALKADIDKGLADVAAGRLKDFDAQRIVERGRKLLATRSSSD